MKPTLAWLTPATLVIAVLAAGVLWCSAASLAAVAAPSDAPVRATSAPAAPASLVDRRHRASVRLGDVCRF